MIASTPSFGSSEPEPVRSLDFQPGLSEPLAHKLAIVRSYTTGDANHDIKPVVSRDSFGATLGSLYSRVAGANHPATGMPTNAALFPQAVDPRSNPYASDLLARDVENLCRHFERYGVHSDAKATARGLWTGFMFADL